MEYKRLDEFLKESTIKVEIDNAQEYKCGGVRLNGRGVFVREIKLGADIQKQWVMHKVEKDNVVYSTLFADKGAFAIATEDDEELVFSEKFVCFKITDDSVLPEYLHVIFQTDYLSSQCNKFKTGMAAFSLSHSSKKKVLKLTVPIPSKEVQRQIVDEYELFERKRIALDDEAERIGGETKALISKYVAEKITGISRCPLSNLGAYLNRPIEVVPGQSYNQITVKLYGNGVVLRKAEDGGNIKSKQFVVRTNDLVYSKIDVKSGAIGFVPEELNGSIVTADFPVVYAPDLTEVDRKFLMIYFSSEVFFEAMQDKSKGTTNRVRAKKSAFLENTVPWGTADERKRIVDEYETLCSNIEKIAASAVQVQDDIPVLTSKYLNKLLKIG